MSATSMLDGLLHCKYVKNNRAEKVSCSSDQNLSVKICSNSSTSFLEYRKISFCDRCDSCRRRDRYGTSISLTRPGVFLDASLLSLLLSLLLSVTTVIVSLISTISCGFSCKAWLES